MELYSDKMQNLAYRTPRMLLACCCAVVVFPHHFGPSTKTAPLPANFRAISPSAILGLYFSFTIQNFLISL